MPHAPRPLIAGNWKMNGLAAEATALINGLSTRLAAPDPPDCDVLVCPPATLLRSVAEATVAAGMALGGQDCHTQPKGAHTGDISAAMLADCRCGFVIVGHSERRTDHGESDALVRAKAAAAQAEGLAPIICIGETAAERDAGEAVAVVRRQLDGSLPPAPVAGTVIAYEPVWAIGTGRTPTTADIAEVHAAIRQRLADSFDDGEAVRILYGGSVKPENAREILAIANVNGALVGGASLSAEDFWTICQSCP